jgi:hypothetical protein
MTTKVANTLVEPLGMRWPHVFNLEYGDGRAEHGGPQG